MAHVHTTSLHFAASLPRPQRPGRAAAQFKPAENGMEEQISTRSKLEVTPRLIKAKLKTAFSCFIDGIVEIMFCDSKFVSNQNGRDKNSGTTAAVSQNIYLLLSNNLSFIGFCNARKLLLQS